MNSKTQKRKLKSAECRTQDKSTSQLHHTSDTNTNGKNCEEATRPYNPEAHTYRNDTGESEEENYEGMETNDTGKD